MAFCSTCGNQLPQGTSFCPSCGSSVLGAVGSSRPSTGTRTFAPDFKKLTVVDWVQGGSAIVVLLCCFLPFYSVSTSYYAYSASAPTLSAFMWLTLITGLAGAVEIFLAASLQPPLLQQSQRALAHVVVAGFTTLLVILFVLVKSPGDGVGFSVAGILEPIACGVWLGFSINGLVAMNRLPR